MVRVVAYVLHLSYDGALAFTRGLSETEEPALWRRDLTGSVKQWIEVGLPDERRLLKACGRADEVIVFAYGRSADIWWSGVRQKLARARNLNVFVLPVDGTLALAALVERSMVLNVNVQDATVWVSAEKGEASLEVVPLN